MLPIGDIMREHRLIEGMITLTVRESAMMKNTNKVDTLLVNFIIGFLRTYADQFHHGKEEDILFRDLRKKELLPEHESILNDLITEHAYARKIVNGMEYANQRYAQGQIATSRDVMKYLDDLIELYPTHIAKEDKQFFIPFMEYFSKKELDNMFNEFLEFDKKMANEQ